MSEAMISKRVAVGTALILLTGLGAAHVLRSSPAALTGSQSKTEFLPPPGSLMDTKKSPIHPGAPSQDLRAHEAQAAVDDTDSEELNPRETEEVLSAAVDIGLRRQNQVSVSGQLTPEMQTLAKYGDRAIAAIAAELARGNQLTTDDALQARIAYVEVLARAAGSNAAAKAALTEYATSPLDVSRPQELIHLDLVDRLESFELLVALDPDAAMQHIKSLKNKRMSDIFVMRYVTGLKSTGITENEAIEKAYKLFGHANAAHTVTTQQKKEDAHASL